MRRLAGDLRNAARSADDAQANVAAIVKGMTFVGPAGDRFRGRMHGIGAQLDSVASRLTSLAGTIDRAADEVEAAQRARAAAIEAASRQAQQQAAPAV
jgi:F0F1-type ATP synthase membrane subunit b/b'